MTDGLAVLQPACGQQLAEFAQVSPGKADAGAADGKTLGKRAGGRLALVKEERLKMAEPGTNDSEKRSPLRAPPEASASRRMLLLLPLMSLGMWLWKTTTEGAGQSRVTYSQLFQLVEQGKVDSLVLDGEVVDATLKSPETSNGRSTKNLKANLAPNDAQLLPLLHQKAVQITVVRQKQPFGVEVLMTLLPWALIIGAWVWMSKRARGALGACCA